MNKIILGEQSRSKVKEGMNATADAVKMTFGYRGRFVLVVKKVPDAKGNPTTVYAFTKDGVSVAESVNLWDNEEIVGSGLIKSGCKRTVMDAGDGTTLTAILIQFLINRAEDLLSKGGRPTDIKSGMQKAIDQVFDLIEAYITYPKGDINLLKSIALTASNDDTEITDAIVEVINLVGASASIDFRMTPSLKTGVEAAEGAVVNIGFINAYFVTNPQMQTAELTNPVILCYDGTITAVNQFAPFLEKCLKQNPKQAILIFCAKMDGEALKTAILNKNNGLLNICVCTSPEWETGIERIRIMEDICKLANSHIISEAKGNELKNVALNQLGVAEKVIVSKVGTTIIGGAGSADKIQKHIESLKESMVVNTDMSDYNKEYTLKRISNMQGKVARINIGGATEDERREKFDRVEDAICAIRAADEQGCVAGGGSVFLRISGALIPDENLNKDELDGFNSVKEALTAPFLQLLDNAKIKPTKPQKDVLSSKKECGFNLKTEKVENLFEAGVLDSAKVLKCSLVNAISVTNLYVMTNASIVNTPKP